MSGLEYRPRVTVVDVLERGACYSGVLGWVLKHSGAIVAEVAAHPDNTFIREAAHADGFGYGDGSGGGVGVGYGYGFGDGEGDGSGYGIGDGSGYGIGYGYGYGGGDGDGDGYGFDDAFNQG